MNNKEVEQKHKESIESLKQYAIDEGFEMPEFSKYKFVAEGYLEFSEPFRKGEVPAQFLNKLRLLHDEGGKIMSLGHHDCTFCIDEGNYENRAMSSSEKILTDWENGVKYQFPKMIFHYIEAHNFKPSDEFIEFIMRDNQQQNIVARESAKSVADAKSVQIWT